MQVHHDKGVAIRIDPESCADTREGKLERPGVTAHIFYCRRLFRRLRQMLSNGNSYD